MFDRGRSSDQEAPTLERSGPISDVAVIAEATSEIKAMETALEGLTLNFHQIIINVPAIHQLDRPPIRSIIIPDPTVANGAKVLRWKSVE